MTLDELYYFAQFRGEDNNKLFASYVEFTDTGVPLAIVLHLGNETLMLGDYVFLGTYPKLQVAADIAEDYVDAHGGDPNRKRLRYDYTQRANDAHVLRESGIGGTQTA